ncbi:SUKH-4 family immunity protein [Actinomadura atramentaria]|uniref:SUKH-4 family immunity protein n=1 Tax=Actinomadura atramentaria TaxID=1990 RepID=UPI00036B6934|nr:SUKH-4 family immunity protein [Actinomadura atramentaria]
MVADLRRETLIGVFGADGVERWPAAPGGIVDEEARRFLLEVGLPSELEPPTVSALPPGGGGGVGLREFRNEHETDWPWFTEDGFGGWFLIGYCSWAGNIFVDGATGVVHFVPDAEEPPSLMNSSVRDFAYFMYAFQRDRDAYTHERTLELAQRGTPGGDDDRDRFVRRMLNFPSMADELAEDPEFVQQQMAYRATARDLAIELQAADPAPFAGDAAAVFERDPELNLTEGFAGPWTYMFQAICDGELG